MRIAYVCHWDLATGDGVAKKIAAQSTAWRDAGHHVEVFAVAPGTGRARASRELARQVRRFAPDLLYLRYDLFLPPVWALARRFRTVVEVNSDDRAEFARRRGRAARAYNELNRRVLLGRADGLVFVTEELASSRSFAGFRQPRAFVANGVTLGPEAPAPSPAARPRALFLGSTGQPWHGVDKLAALAAALPELDVDVVGYTAEELANAVSAVPANVRPHGRLAREGYEPILRRADVGIGTLALHRKQMEQAAPLKVREYLESGLPVVIAYDDVDLRGVDAWWLLRLENREGTFDAARVRAFVESVRGRRVPRAEVEPRISWAAKERERLAFLTTVAGA